MALISIGMLVSEDWKLIAAAGLAAIGLYKLGDELI